MLRCICTPSPDEAFHMYISVSTFPFNYQLIFYFSESVPYTTYIPFQIFSQLILLLCSDLDFSTFSKLGNWTLIGILTYALGFELEILIQWRFSYTTYIRFVQSNSLVTHLFFTHHWLGGIRFLSCAIPVACSYQKLFFDCFSPLCMTIWVGMVLSFGKSFGLFRHKPGVGGHHRQINKKI